MPQVNIWIRKSDLEKWKVIYTPEWLHEVINFEPAVLKSLEQKLRKETNRIGNDILKNADVSNFKVIKTKEDAKKIVEDNQAFISKKFSAR